MVDISEQLRGLPLYANAERCSGATYIVTGANTGLGVEAAKHLVASDAAKVIMAVRNVEAGEAAKARIEKETGKTNVAQVWALDLSSYDSVKAFAKRAITELDRIDAVIENAALASPARDFSEGHLTSVTVNLLSTILLGILLLPKLSECAKKFNIVPHINFVVSGAGFDVKEDFDKIRNDPLAGMDSEEFMALKSYPMTKLLETMAVRHLATLVPVSRTGVVLNYTCPGLCKTELGRNSPQEFKDKLAHMHASFGRTAEDGSRTLLFGALAGKESHGLMLDSCRIFEEKLPSWITDEEGVKSQKHIWDLIAKELEAAEPGCVTKILQ